MNWKRFLSGAALLLILAVISGFVVYIWANEWFMARFFMVEMEADQRVEQLQVDRVVETLHLQKGDCVADIGAGTGLFSRPIAKKIGPKGMLYAVDINEYLLADIDRRARLEGLDNLQTILADDDNPRLPQKVDLVFICDTYHHIENKMAYLKVLRENLNAKGRIAIIDYKKNWPPFHETMKYTPKELETWMHQSGYRRIARYDYLNDYFFVIYQKVPLTDNTATEQLPSPL